MFRRILAGTVMGLALALPGSAFNTGYHYDMTFAALVRVGGFEATAIESIQVANWLTDYYPERKGEIGEAILRGVKSGRIPPLPDRNEHMAHLEACAQLLHCDNLDNHQKTVHYLKQLEENTKSMLREFAKSNTHENHEKAIIVIGSSLHAVQDFYSHSNFVSPTSTDNVKELNLRTHFSEATRRSDLLTGKYDPPPTIPYSGNTTHEDLNKDHSGRPGWHQAYISADLASEQWVELCREWVNEVDSSGAFWLKLTKFDYGGRESDLRAAREISSLASVPPIFPGDTIDGKWKSEGSGSFEEFIPVAVRFMFDVDSELVTAIKHSTNQKEVDLWGRLTKDLYNPQNGFLPLQSRPAVQRQFQVLELRTLAVDSLLPLLPGQMDYYSKVLMRYHPRMPGRHSEQEFLESTQQDKDHIVPHWQTLMLLPVSATRVSVIYEIMNEDVGDHEVCDINPGIGGHLRFDFDLTSKNFSGDFSGLQPAEGWESKGDQGIDKSKVRLKLRTIPIKP